jgi:hypothetical protein
MSFSISMPKTGEAIQFDSLLVLTRAAIGIGIGMLMADKIKRAPVRQTAALALLSLGAIAAVPFLVRLTTEQIDRSELGSRARLRSIRSASGYRSDTDAF